MCEAMIDALLAWRDDDAVEAVVIDHSKGRGFCAGGDIRMLAESGAKDGKEARAFFHTEYRLNHLLFTYPKPVAAFMDGITMRSEEHTSELQSLMRISYAVFCLKKKKKNTNIVH